VPVPPTHPVMAWPMGEPRRVLSPFGDRIMADLGTAELHQGVDLAGEKGEPVRAAAAGTVVFAGTRPAFGSVVIVDHGGRWYTVYGNLESASVREGDRVQSGSILGILNGRCEVGGDACLHFEVRFGGEAVDPLAVLPSR
jgi:murein DD-endopeptidase MepM/ murein hydrolase activator NlpD